MGKPFNGIYDVKNGPYSTNANAERLMGRREIEGKVIIDLPCELGYHCPVCEYETLQGGSYDERLDWSEYNSFLYCHVCDRDYPSALCHSIEPSEWTPSSIDIYLRTVELAILRDREQRGQ